MWLSLPISLGQAAHGILFVIDTGFAGRLGDAPLAASAFVGNVLVLPLLFGFGLLTSVSVLTAQGRGAGRPGDAEPALRHGLLVGVGYGLAVAVGWHALVAAGGLNWFGQDAEVVAEAHDFALLMGWSTVPAMLFQSLKNHREAVQQPWVALLWLGAGVVVNVIVNYVLMFGHFGAPALGLAGAGWGTVAARVVSLTGLVFHRGGSRPRWHLGVQRRWLRESLTLGVPSAVQWTFEVGVFTCAAVVIGGFGKHQLAAHQVVVSLASLAFMVPAGLSQGTSIRVGEAFGAKNAVALRRIAAGALAFGGGFMALYALVVTLLAGHIPAWFLGAENAAGETAALATRMIFVAAAFAIFDGLQVVASGALRGISDVRFSSLSAFICYWLVSMPVALPLAYWADWKGVGIWVGLAFGIAMAAVVLNARLAWQTHRYRRLWAEVRKRE